MGDVIFLTARVMVSHGYGEESDDQEKENSLEKKIKQNIFDQTVFIYTSMLDKKNDRVITYNSIRRDQSWRINMVGRQVPTN